MWWKKDRCAMVNPSDMSDIKFLTIAEVAAVMRVSKMTVYRLVHNGELPAVRVGRSFRVPEQAVHDCALCGEPLGDVRLLLVRHRGEHRIPDGFCSVDHLAEWAKGGGRWR